LAFVEDQVFTECVKASQREPGTTSQRTAPRFPWRQLSRYAACLALAGSLGYLIGQSPNADSSRVADVSSEADRSLPPYTLTLHDASGGEEKTLEVPAYDATQLTAFLNGLQNDSSLE